MPHRRLTFVSLVLGTLVVSAFAVNSVTPILVRGQTTAASVVAGAPGQEVATIPVDGMTCFSCELHVEKVLKDTPGVFDAEANTAQQNALVTYDPIKVSVADLVAAINTKTGYKARQP